jgi:uncharacterized protein (DUF433 family)
MHAQNVLIGAPIPPLKPILPCLKRYAVLPLSNCYARYAQTLRTGSPMATYERITVDPEIMTGKPVVAGTRIPVELVLKRLAEDLDVQALLEAYPRLTVEDVQACVRYGHSLVASEEFVPVVRPDASRSAA